MEKKNNSRSHACSRWLRSRHTLVHKRGERIIHALGGFSRKQECGIGYCFFLVNCFGGTDDHDFDFKAKHAENFLKDGNKVKAYVQFKGRAIMFQDRGQLLLLKFAERLAEVGVLESMPKMEGKRMLAMFAPKSAKKKA